MRITRLESFLTNAGLRNYLFVRLTADNGQTGLGEASLEWQERAVQVLLHDWVEERILGTDPRDIEQTVQALIRDQYQGGATVMTAISGVELACWDLVGKAAGQPVFQLLGGRARERLPAYANGWYGGCQTPEQYARRAVEVAARGYGGMKFDPLGVAWNEMTEREIDQAVSIFAAVRGAVGDQVDLMFEAHGRLSVGCAVALGRRLAPYRPAWYEEPVTPWSLDQLLAVRQSLDIPLAAGERLYMLEEFERLTALAACHIAQPDLAHCGGMTVGRKIARLAAQAGMRLAPHCSIGPVALCAAVHFGWATPEVLVQEYFGDYDVPWRKDYVCGWNPVEQGHYLLPHKPGWGIELDESVCAAHPYQRNPFPSLWDDRWVKELTKSR